MADADGKEQQVPLMKLCAGVVYSTGQDFTDIREITEVSAEARRQARARLRIRHCRCALDRSSVRPGARASGDPRRIGTGLEEDRPG